MIAKLCVGRWFSLKCGIALVRPQQCICHWVFVSGGTLMAFCLSVIKIKLDFLIWECPSSNWSRQCKLTLSSKTDIHPLICYFSVSDTAPETVSLAELTSPPSSLTSSFLKFKSHRDSELPAPTFSWVACCWDSFFQRTIRSLKSKNLEVCLCLMTQH